MSNEEFVKELTELRNKLYDSLPTSSPVNGFKLVLVISKHIRKLDKLIEKYEHL